MIKEKILVTGADGLVGSRFTELSKSKYDLFTPDYKELDLTNQDAVYKYINKINPDWIVNFAAFTDVNQAETQAGDEKGLAWKVNVEGVKNLTNAFLSDHFIQISTDMVFPGSLENPGPYAEYSKTAQTPDQLTWYGWTKNQAEKIILNHGGAILRIVYPVRANFSGKLDYIRGVLQRYSDSNLYPLFADQQIATSYIDEVAFALQHIIDQEAKGIFHCASDTTTPFELLSYVFDQLDLDMSILKKSSLVEFLKTQANPNRYPLYGGLKTVNTENELGIHFSSWQTVVEKLVAQGLVLPPKTN